jgi:hypothetical protein
VVCLGRMKQTNGLLGRLGVVGLSGQVGRSTDVGSSGPLAKRGVGSPAEVVASGGLARSALPDVAAGSLRFGVHPHQLAAQGSLRLCQGPALEFAQRRALPASPMRRGRPRGCHQPAGCLFECNGRG